MDKVNYVWCKNRFLSRVWALLRSAILHPFTTTLIVSSDDPEDLQRFSERDKRDRLT